MNESTALQIKEPDITPLLTRIDALVSASNIAVTDDVSQKIVTAHKNKLKELLSEIELKEDEFTKPLNEVLKNIRKVFKPAKDKLNETISFCATELNKYYVDQKELERKEQERQDKLAQKRFDRNEESGKGNPLPVPVSAHVELAQKKVQTDSGGITYIDRWVAEVVDITKIPLYLNGIQLLIPAQSVLDKLANDSKGKVEIPGVRCVYKPFQRSR